jgi:hypothetical protein
MRLWQLVRKGTVLERPAHAVAVRAGAASSRAHNAAVRGTDTWTAAERVVRDIRRAAATHKGW